MLQQILAVLAQLFMQMTLARPSKPISINGPFLGFSAKMQAVAGLDSVSGSMTLAI